MALFLIAGLGNPGPQYALTRHNLGFLVADALAQRRNAGPWKTEKLAEACTATLEEHRLLIIKPTTFMNLSGKAVQYYMQFHKLPLTQVLVLVDDVSLPFGSLRLRPEGSAGGHNGLKDIQQRLGSGYPRLRLGIGGHYEHGQQVDYVLGRFSPAEQQHLPAFTQAAAQATEAAIARGLPEAMTAWNRSVL